GNARDNCGVGVLPCVPNAATPDFATGTGVPWAARLGTFAVVIGEVGIPTVDGGVEVTGIAGAGVKEWRDSDASGIGVGDQRIIELIGPIGKAARPDVAAEDFEVEHGHESFAIGFGVAADDDPELVFFVASAVGFRMSEVICAHDHTRGFAVV